MGKTKPRLPIKNLNLKEWADQDYANRLSVDDLAFLKKFNREYYLARDIGVKNKPLHKTKAHKKSIRSFRYAHEHETYLTTAHPRALEEATTPDPTDAIIEAIDVARNKTKNKKR